MSEKGPEADIEPGRLNVAEVPLADILIRSTSVGPRPRRLPCPLGELMTVANFPECHPCQFLELLWSAATAHVRDFYTK